MPSDSVDAFEQDVWSLVSEGELQLLTKQEMADALHSVAFKLDSEHYGRTHET